MRKASDVPVTAGDTRRVFVLRACQAAAALSVSGAMQGCGGGGSRGGSPTSPSPLPGASNLPVVTAAVSGSQATVTIDGSPLATLGGAALVQAGSLAMLVARTGQDAFSALTATCTHEACTINGVTGTTFVCPCHGSRFSSSGAVINGPATRALPQFGTQFANGVLTIAL